MSTPTHSAMKKNIIGAIIFGLIAYAITTVAPSIEVIWVSAFLLLTIYLFAFEVVSVDVAAATVMVLLGLTSLLAPWMGLKSGLVANDQIFGGFSSNAVISIIAVMIIGAGLDKSGIMSKVASFILKVGGQTEQRIVPVISSTVGIISSFMQNVGAAALFLPVVSRISARTGLPMSRLLMPMGFCAILGGTLTMVGSSPLILLNDLITTSNKALPQAQQMETFSLFSVTPIGLALITTGILYFVLAGRFVLPVTKSGAVEAENSLAYFKRVYGLDYDLKEVKVNSDSPLANKALDEFESTTRTRVVVIQKGAELRFGPGMLQSDLVIEANTILGVIGSPSAISNLSELQLTVKTNLEQLTETLAATQSGIAELVIPPGSTLIGKSPRDIWMRKTYGLSLLANHRGGKTMREGEGVRDIPLEVGDTLVVHTSWAALHRLESERNFVVVTTEYPHEESRPNKMVPALVFFGITLGMVLFSNVLLSVALLTGAFGMILTGVIKIEEAYQAVSWKTVFLLASLIPLGLATQTSGTAGWIAEQTLNAVGDLPTWVLQAAIAVLATFFTLVMSNVGATVLLVPLAVNIAIGAGANPAVFALTVAIATSNSFLLPTHQVNALLMGPGGYRVVDYIRAGGVMTILFLVVSLSILNIIF